MTHSSTEMCLPAVAPGGKIAVVIDSMTSGGAQRVVAHLVSAWIADGRSVDLITFAGRDQDFYALPSEVVREVVGGRGNSTNPLAAIIANGRRILRLRRALRASESSVVLSFITSMNVLTILAGFGLGKRIVVSERNDPVRQDPGRIWRTLRRWTYRWAGAVTANSDHAVAVMAAYVPREKLATVPNPVHLPQKQASPAKSSAILNVGRLVPQKGQADILTAFADVVRKRQSWRLTILGEGTCRQSLAKQAMSLGLQKLCQLPGNVPDPSGHYRSAAVFVLASRYEGTPNTLLEAMAHGLACIVPDCLPGALEHVEDGVSGVVYRAGEDSELARCMAILMDDPALRARLGAAARERMGKLSPDYVLRRWDEVLFSSAELLP